MIIGVRVDDRLIHGQVQTQWISSLQLKRIIIIDSFVANDMVSMQILKIAKPPSIDLVVIGEERALEIIEKDSAQKNVRTLLMFKTINTAAKIYQMGVELSEIVIGPSSSKQNSTQVSKNTYFSKEEIESAKFLHNRGVQIIFQLLPGEEPKEWSELKL